MGKQREPTMRRVQWAPPRRRRGRRLPPHEWHHCAPATWARRAARTRRQLRPRAGASVSGQGPSGSCSGSVQGVCREPHACIYPEASNPAPATLGGTPSGSSASSSTRTSVPHLRSAPGRARAPGAARGGCGGRPCGRRVRAGQSPGMGRVPRRQRLAALAALGLRGPGLPNKRRGGAGALRGLSPEIARGGEPRPSVQLRPQLPGSSRPRPGNSRSRRGSGSRPRSHYSPRDLADPSTVLLAPTSRLLGPQSQLTVFFWPPCPRGFKQAV